MHAAAQILVIETSTAQASTGILTREGSWHGMDWEGGRDHHRLLFGKLRDLFETSGIAAGEFDTVLVGSGPGSYSGTRVGIAAGLGLAAACRCPVVAVPSTSAVPTSSEVEDVLVIGDARRGHYWWARISSGVSVGNPSLGLAEEFQAVVEAACKRGTAIVSWENPDRFPLNPMLMSCMRREHPTASGILRTWQQVSAEQRHQWESRPPEPIYLMPPLITPSRKHWNIDHLKGDVASPHGA